MDNSILKSACIKALKADEAELAKINELTLSPVTAEQVFTFKLKLCDNEVDRDTESFTIDALKKLAELFKGKTGIKDHSARTDNQISRIYDTEIITEADKLTALGEEYTYLEAHCYILRIAKNEDLIAEIEAGIKKEVSVRCAMTKRYCSICGKESSAFYGTACEHAKGKLYDGKICCIRLDQAVDAYEFSFVAIPAQRDAGAKKSGKEAASEDISDGNHPTNEIVTESTEENGESVTEGSRDVSEPEKTISSLNVFENIFNNLLN